MALIRNLSAFRTTGAQEDIGPDIAGHQINVVPQNEALGCLLPFLGVELVVPVDDLDGFLAHPMIDVLKRKFHRVAHVAPDDSRRRGQRGDKPDLDVSRCRSGHTRNNCRCSQDPLAHVRLPMTKLAGRGPPLPPAVRGQHLGRTHRGGSSSGDHNRRQVQGKKRRVHTAQNAV